MYALIVRPLVSSSLSLCRCFFFSSQYDLDGGGGSSLEAATVKGINDTLHHFHAIIKSRPLEHKGNFVVLCKLVTANDR